jgi:hypothetical protein
MTTVPPRPTLKSATPLSSSTIRVIFEGGGDGGSVILAWQIGYGTHTTSPQGYVDSDGNTVLGGFNPGQRIYFWARGRNAVGWGPWSNRGAATTWNVPGAPVNPIIQERTQTTILLRYTDPGSNGTPLLERQIGYGLSAGGPTDYATVAVHGLRNLIGLEPGGTYYFWARARNAVGWGPWSARTETNLIAGARVRIGNQWKRAVPYVRVGGVWKVAQPWVKRTGRWRETSI